MEAPLDSAAPDNVDWAIALVRAVAEVATAILIIWFAVRERADDRAFAAELEAMMRIYERSAADEVQRAPWSPPPMSWSPSSSPSSSSPSSLAILAADDEEWLAADIAAEQDAHRLQRSWARSMLQSPILRQHLSDLVDVDPARHSELKAFADEIDAEALLSPAARSVAASHASANSEVAAASGPRAVS